MALTDLFLADRDETPLLSAQLHGMFPKGQVGDGNDYVFFLVINNHAAGSWSFTSGTVWVTVDPGGGTFAIAVGDATARARGYGYAFPAASGLTYSTPTTQGAGLTVPTLAPGQKALFCARRNLASATQAYPEENRINVGGTVPIGF